jgi:hypothetical protein
MFRSAIISSGDIKSLKTSQKPFQNPWMGWAWQQHIIQNPGYSAYIWHMYVRTYVRMYVYGCIYQSYICSWNPHSSLIPNMSEYHINHNPLGSRPLFGGAELDRKAYQISVAWCGSRVNNMTRQYQNHLGYVQTCSNIVQTIPVQYCGNLWVQANFCLVWVWVEDSQESYP